MLTEVRASCPTCGREEKRKGFTSDDAARQWAWEWGDRHTCPERPLLHGPWWSDEPYRPRPAPARRDRTTEPLWVSLDLADRDPFGGMFGDPTRRYRFQHTGHECRVCGAVITDRGRHMQRHTKSGVQMGLLQRYASILAGE